MLTQLNPARLFGGTLITPDQRSTPAGAHWPAVVLLAAWLVSVYGAFRLRMRTLLLLDAVIGTALVLGVISTARIFGTVWFYLLLWAVSLSALMLLTIGWTIVEAIRVRVDRDVGARLASRDLGWRRGNGDRLCGARVLGAQRRPHVAAHERADGRTDSAYPCRTRTPGPRRARPGRTTSRGCPTRKTSEPRDTDCSTSSCATASTPTPTFSGARARRARTPSTGPHSAAGPPGDRIRHRALARRQSLPGDRVLRPALAGRTGRVRRAVRAGHRRVERDGLADRLPRLRDDTDGLLLDNSLPESTQKILSRMLALGLPAAVFIGPVVDPPAVTTTTR